jgi:hypothetical protein
MNSETKRKYNEKYRLEHKDEIRKKSLRHYLDHKDDINEQRRRKRLEHIDEYRERDKKYRLEHIDEYRERDKKYYSEHSNKIRKGVRTRYKEHKIIVIDHYTNGMNKCVCCGEHRFKFLTTDHINGGGTKQRRELKNKDYNLWLIKHNFPEGHQILCYNCNCGRAYNNGICPHKED